ncbi:hypothetical protein GCM10023149_03170 [Mucilaginibacter gynuensis]|uniref:HTH luxR-type domain-containing protein n=1 Tax=Mucilaginibacter gynuensis TaxID=1302236 RepID=A0ABP8FQL9_9SPHI
MNLNPDALSKIDDFAPYAELMPCVVMIHQIGEFNLVYMTSNGLKLLGVTLLELQEMGAGYYPRFFNMEYMEGLLPKMDALLRNNSTEDSFSYFQQVKLQGKTDWTWHITSTRIFMWDEAGNPTLTITTAVPIERMKYVEAKAEKILNENLFLRRNLEAFSTLGKREKTVLKLVATGKSSPEIADELFISAETVQTHRRNIKIKLGISNVMEFAEYARAFDLI